MRRFSLLVAAVTLAIPASAGAVSSGPLSPGLPAAPTQTQTQTQAPAPIVAPAPSNNSSGDSALSGGTALGIGIGALAVLGGISAFIWRDARRRAPVRQSAMATVGAGGRGGSKPRNKQRKLSPAERRRRKRGRAR